ncbi:MAG: hypothetical protein ACREFW_00905 [Rhizomicrobium sp.]
MAGDVADPVKELGDARPGLQAPEFGGENEELVKILGDLKPGRHKLRRPLLATALLVTVLPNRGLAGPPFQTDDPEPVDLGHYEFYVFSGSDGTPVETDPLGPAFEFNWGALPNTQLHAVVSFGAILPSNNPASAPAGIGPKNYGLLDSELGVKYRWISQTADFPEVGTFTMIELPPAAPRAGPRCGQDLVQAPNLDAERFWSLDHLRRRRI